MLRPPDPPDVPAPPPSDPLRHAPVAPAPRARVGPAVPVAPCSSAPGWSDPPALPAVLPGVKTACIASLVKALAPELGPGRASAVRPLPARPRRAAAAPAGGHCAQDAQTGGAPGPQRRRNTQRDKSHDSSLHATSGLDREGHCSSRPRLSATKTRSSAVPKPS